MANAATVARQLADTHDPLFVDEVVSALIREQSPYSQLQDAQQLLGLTITDTATLFGIKRQALADWAQKGVPVARLGQLDALVSAALLLRRSLRPIAIPTAVRRPAPNLGGRSLLQYGAQEGMDALYDEVRDTLDVRRMTR